ncbi:DNA-directed RNA polymerase subunit P [Rosistilla carotiformis]|uniref:DNA-directed RNA polymerase subunit P n=1 Tax=Rosistilla carotiformis TaxID=2528017 RepID=A0A518JSA6_9BACT|nr:DNA-directed RNA polymerase subunit P [Rosistilla carotiformis]
MSIAIQCRTCKNQLQVTLKQAGKRVRCPSCQETVSVPYEADLEEIQQSAAKAFAGSKEKIKIRCPGCEKVLQISAASAGKAVKCPGCAKIFKVPAIKP